MVVSSVNSTCGSGANVEEEESAYRCVIGARKS